MIAKKKRAKRRKVCRTQEVRPLQVYSIGYRKNMSSSTVHEIEVMGYDCYADVDNSSTEHGQRLWLVLGQNQATAFQIPVWALVSCVAKDAVVKKSATKSDKLALITNVAVSDKVRLGS